MAVVSGNERILTSIFLAILLCNSLHPCTNAKTLIILHNNNIFSRFEQIENRTGYCVPTKICVGGFARMSTVLKKFRKYNNQDPEAPIVIYLYAGGLFTGSMWFTIHKSKIAIEMMNLLAPEAMSLGYPEFEAGVTELSNFMNGVKFPIVCANIDVSRVPKLSKIAKSTILYIRGLKIGVVGHIVERTSDFAIINDDIKFGKEVKAVNIEADTLRKQGADIIISLGYSDWSVHKNIAKNVRNVDVVVGSMRNILLLNGKATHIFSKEGNYPDIVSRKNSEGEVTKRIPAVTTYGYTLYMGCLNLTLNAENKITKAVGQPLYMENEIEQDPEVLKALEKYRKAVDQARHEVIGKTRVKLEGGKQCYLKECNFGNLMADAYIYHAMSGYYGKYWTDTPAAFIHSQMVVRGLNLKINANVSHGHIMEAFPVELEAESFDILGKHLLEALEVSGGVLPENEGAEFLQFSGLHVAYDFANPLGKRVVSAKIRCGQCWIPTYSDILKNETYRVMAPQLLTSGGLGYKVLKKNKDGIKSSSMTSTDILVEYIKKQKLLYPIEGDRITIHHREAIAAKTCLAKMILLFTLCIVSDHLINY